MTEDQIITKSKEYAKGVYPDLPKGHLINGAPAADWVATNRNIAENAFIACAKWMLEQQNEQRKDIVIGDKKVFKKKP